MAEKTVLSIYGTHPVEPLPENVYRVYADDLPDPELVLGVELEIESWDRARRAHQAGFNYEADGSLRNHGIEAITTPTKAKHLRDMLGTFFQTHRIDDSFYSDRCSTHVHMNVQDCTVNEVKVICLLYQIFERLLFKFVGHDREDNIFCVPWHQSGITSAFVDKLAKNFDNVARNWVKYTSLNLLPMREKGTIEFRHLHGTCDLEVIMQWIRFISHMRVYAKKHTYKELSKVLLDMNTVSNYDVFIMDVFGHDAAALMQGDYKAALNVGVVDAKLMVLKQPKATPKRNLDDLLRETEGRMGLMRPAMARPADDRPDPWAQVNPFLINQVEQARERALRMTAQLVGEPGQVNFAGETPDLMIFDDMVERDAREEF